MNLENQIVSYIDEHHQFKEILEHLRTLILNQGFEENIKWGIPTYTFEGKNLVSMAGFKNHVGLWFFQGALLKDEHNILHNAQEGKTKALRQVHFKNLKEIDETILYTYLKETLDNHKKGLQMQFEKKKIEVVIPNELASLLQTSSALEAAFNKLTPGRKKEYAEYIASAKRDQTKANRIVKIAPLILAGKGLNDKYKSNN